MKAGMAVIARIGSVKTGGIQEIQGTVVSLGPATYVAERWYRRDVLVRDAHGNLHSVRATRLTLV